MIIEENTAILFSMAFGLGLMHALDADHIMAITGLSQDRRRSRTILNFCLRWSVGHGLTLLTLGMAVFYLGQTIPPAFSHHAEVLVALILIGISILIVLRLWQQNAHLHFHSHHGYPDHAHWHQHRSHSADHDNDTAHRHRHTPTIIGMLHGAAGSAPVLALIPASQIQSPGLALTYLMCFGAGICLAMLVFGGLLAQLFNGLRRWGSPAIKLVQGAIAISSFSLGTMMLLELWS